MEKALWNIAGVVLVVLNLFAVIWCFAEQTTISGVILLLMAVVDAIYESNRPIWLEG